MNRNFALFSSFLFKIHKAYFIFLNYRLKITSSEKTTKLYEIHICSDFFENDSYLFRWKVDEISLEFFIELKSSKYIIRKTKTLTNLLKRKGIRKFILVIREELFNKSIPLFLKFIVFPLMIMHIKNSPKGISLIL